MTIEVHHILSDLYQTEKLIELASAVNSGGGGGSGGVAGPQGPVGSQGERGLQGEKGDVGATGSQGIQGIQGPVGPKGDTGSKGDKGDTGAAGPIGPTGLQGATGAAGTDGLVVKGAWNSATAYVAKDFVTYNGSGYIAHAAGTNKLPTDTAFWTLFVAQGAVGPQGPAGVAGSQGVQGIAGAKGDKGDKGDAGVQGPAGATGAAGVAGANGKSLSAKGVWSASTTYNALDVVNVGSTSYISLKDANLNKAPATNTADWMINSQQGVSFVWKSNWSSSTAYVANDVVRFTNGNLYIAKQSGTNQSPPAATTFWDLFVEAPAVVNHNINANITMATGYDKGVLYCTKTNSDTTISVPVASLPVGFMVSVINTVDKNITFVQTSGTLSSKNNALTLNGQWATCTLQVYETGKAILVGDLKA